MIAKGTGYVKGNKRIARFRLNHHLKYIEHRKRGSEENREDRYLFGKERDHVERSEVLDDVLRHTSRSVSYHKIVLSPAKNEPVHDWKAWTRATMDDTEQRRGITLHWYAVKHGNTDDPHVHIVLAGSGEDLKTSKPRPVPMYTSGKRTRDGKSDYAFLRERAGEHSQQQQRESLQGILQETTQRLAKELEREYTIDRIGEQERRAKSAAKLRDLGREPTFRRVVDRKIEIR